MIISILPTTFAIEAEASDAITYTYAYDAQRKPAFPASKDDKVTVSGLQKPLRAGASAMSGVFRYENNKGAWKLTEVGPYSGISSASPKPSSFLRPIVKSIADKYGISDMNTVVIHQLTDKMGNHVAYGVIISINESKGYAIFLADLFNESGAGVFLSKNEVTESSVSFASDKNIQTKTSSTPTYNTTGYHRAELSLSEIPVAGKKPVNLKYTRSDAEITMQEWSGTFDENGCFKPGEAYTLTAELTIKENSNSSFITTPGVLEVEFFHKASSDFFAEIISLTPYAVKAKYTFYTDDETDFAIDEYGTALANINLDVYKDASAGAKTIGEIKINEKVKVLRAYVNGNIVYSKHMIEYNGGIGYVRGCNSFGKDKYFRSVKVEGKIDPNNVPSNRVPDFGNTEKAVVNSVAISSFKADYGTKPVLTVFESDYYKATSIEYSTDMVNEKFSPVTATVTYIPTSPNYIERIFSEKTTASKGEIISVSEKMLVVKYTTYSGGSDTYENLPDGAYAYAKKVESDGVLNKYAYAKAKVKSMGGNAKIYNYPAIHGGKEIGSDTLYIRDETVNLRFPGLNEKWVIVSKERTGQCFFIPAAFLESYEYLETYMPGAPGDSKNTPFKFAGGSGSISDPFLIETADQLNAVRYGMDLHYKLIADIDLSNWGNWIPLGATPAYGGFGGGWNKAEDGCCSFQGSFDGNGHVVSGMKIIINEATPYLTEGTNIRLYGLFGTLATNPPENSIKNLGIVNFTIDVTYTDVKKPLEIWASSFCGPNFGTDFYNCYSSGGKINFNITGNYNTPGKVNIMIGGINCDASNSHIEKCFNDSDISVNVTNSERVIYAGGIVGLVNVSHIHECYNTGDITVPTMEGQEVHWGTGIASGICAYAAIPEIPGIYHIDTEGATFIQNCYNTGSLTGVGTAGILFYATSDAHLENCYNIGKLSGNKTLIGKGISTENTIIFPGSDIVDYGTEFIRDCSGNGNAVSGSAWKSSSSLGRKVLVSHPEDNPPSKAYNFISTGVAGFTDVKSDAWYATPVSWAVTKKITSGTSSTTFSPDATCTKAQILTFLWRAVGSPKPEIKNPFTDVKATDYFYEPALWAYEYGIISGTAFLGDTPCTRSATVMYMWKSVGAPKISYGGNFTDVAAGSEYASAVAWALNSNVTSGTSDTTFSPETTCTRGQIVTFLNRAFK